MVMERRHGPVLIAVAGAAIALAGCASNRPADTQADQIERASQRISEAERNGAYQYGSDALNLARDKLKAAQKAASDNDEQKAQWLAEEAALDADYAAATAGNQEIQTALSEQQEGVRTLQQELQRNQQRQTSQLPADNQGRVQ
jgi:hypothetical protein